MFEDQVLSYLKNDIAQRIESVDKTSHETRELVLEIKANVEAFRAQQEAQQKQIDALEDQVNENAAKTVRLETNMKTVKKDLTDAHRKTNQAIEGIRDALGRQEGRIWKIVWKVLPWIGVAGLIAERVFNGR